jgi:hypothetical protein
MIYRIVYHMTNSKQLSTRELEADSREQALSAFHDYMGSCGAEREKYRVTDCHLFLRITNHANDYVTA